MIIRLFAVVTRYNRGIFFAIIHRTNLQLAFHIVMRFEQGRRQLIDKLDERLIFTLLFASAISLSDSTRAPLRFNCASLMAIILLSTSVLPGSHESDSYVSISSWIGCCSRGRPSVSSNRCSAALSAGDAKSSMLVAMSC